MKFFKNSITEKIHKEHENNSFQKEKKNNKKKSFLD